MFLADYQVMSRSAVYRQMPGHWRRSVGGPLPSSPALDKCLIPLSAFLYVSVIAPLLIFVTTGPPRTIQDLMVNRIENKIFWPAAAAASIAVCLANGPRLGQLKLPFNVRCLITYLILAGMSAVWALKPDISLNRLVFQVLVVISIVPPILLASARADVLRGLFLCFATVVILNLYFVLNNDPAIVERQLGHPGYFVGKNLLGEFMGIAVVLALHEVVWPGSRRMFGAFILASAIPLLLLSQSKTSLALAIISPFLAAIILIIVKWTRVSVAGVLLPIPFLYMVISKVFGITLNKLSYLIYKNYTFSGRTDIWDFVAYEIGRRPILGWGYLSFWLVGPDGPSVTEATGWIKHMPNAHNGYLDATLDLGYIGLAIFLAFIMTTLHSIGRVAERDGPRAWIMLSLALFVICDNFLESTWARGAEMLWLVFLVVAAEAGRYLQSPSIERSIGPGVSGRGRAGQLAGPRVGPPPYATGNVDRSISPGAGWGRRPARSAGKNFKPSR